jgi:hypothetical protein
MDSIKRGLELCAIAVHEVPCHLRPRPWPGREVTPVFNARRPKLTIEGIADQLLEGLPLGHDPMPRWEFSEQQAEDLLLYIEYIGRKKTLQ